jgi:hypothetical protein
MWRLPVQGNGISLYEIDRDWSKYIIPVLTTWIVWSTTTCCRPDCLEVKSTSHQYSILTVKVSICFLKTGLRIPDTHLNKKLGNTSPYAGLHKHRTLYIWNIPRKQTNDNSFCLKVKLKTEGMKDLHDGLMSVYIYTINVLVDIIFLTKKFYFSLLKVTISKLVVLSLNNL